MSTPVFTTIFKTYSASVGAHALTQRWIYTVPLGHRAEVVYMHDLLEDNNPQGLAISLVFFKLTLSAVVDNTLALDTRNAIGLFSNTTASTIPMFAGDSIEGYTLNGAATNLIMRVQAVIKEYQ